MTMTLYEAKQITDYLITDKGKGYDWRVCNKFLPGMDAMKLALDVIPRGSARHTALNSAVKSELQAKEIRYHWLVKSLASAFEDDANGDHITIEMLEYAKVYRKVNGL